MRVISWCVTLAATAAFAGTEPACPFDAQVAAQLSADGGVVLEDIARAMRARPDVRAWLNEAKTCKVETKPRLVRVLEGLSRKCTSAVVELQLEARDCRTIEIRVGDGPRRMYALVTPDARGVLRPVWSFIHDVDPVPPARVTNVTRVECGSSLVSTDGGVERMSLLVGNPSLHFDGCLLQGVSDELVRRELSECLARSESAEVTVRFFEADAGVPTCVAFTGETEAGRIGVVRSGIVMPHGPFVDSGLFVHAAGAYFEQSSAGPQWLCADLALGDAKPFEPPPAARQGCTPLKKKEALIVRSEDATGFTHFVAERHDLAFGAADAGIAALRIDRAVLERGLPLDNELELARLLESAVATLSSCVVTPGDYDGALGGVVLTNDGSVASASLDWKPRDADCAKRVIAELRKFRGKKPYRSGLQVFRFRIRAR